ncbi:MAG: hypothetical protein E6K81_15665 [Candidatus Eisenbacteria bacterium]|uniref:Uncharacterized protein n=1 Tax=Eiseniibacteriota bacterium TaxID=2212470 RepID=A0A538TZU9_UNCEI|nr:MAG: hypothetical protein E6K81_15665 [Candidatus Eisenbacteria bacterium]
MTAREPESGPSERVRAGGSDLIAIAGCALLAAWVFRRALFSFFSSPDDLFYLEQAVGLRPTPLGPFRFLSQVVYFRAMVGLVGLDPFPFHAVSLLVHIVNAALVYALARMAGARRIVAWLGAVLFATFPLSETLLSSAVGINDEAALALALTALICLRRPGIRWRIAASVSFALALASKESVIFLPVLALWLRPASMPLAVAARRARPLFAISAVVAMLFILLRPAGLAPGGEAYAIHFGSNLFHDLMTYLSWSVDLVRPLPDLVSSIDPTAWRVGIWVVAAIVLCRWRWGAQEPAIRLGLVWGILGLLPVLPLRFQTYRHYLYPAVPGLALIVAGALVQSLMLLGRLPRPGDTAVDRRVRPRLVVTLVVLAVLAYALRADHLIAARLALRMPGSQLALDPVERRREVAVRALASLHQHLGPDHAAVAVYSPSGMGRVFSARTGQEYPGIPAGRHSYDLLAAVTDSGRVFRLFLPQIDSVAFLDRWSCADTSFTLFLPYYDGDLFAAGRGRRALAATGRWMFEQRWYPQAREYLDSVLVAYPEDREFLLLRAGALLKIGERAAARGQLEHLIRLAPNDSAASVARRALATWER